MGPVVFCNAITGGVNTGGARGRLTFGKGTQLTVMLGKSSFSRELGF